MLLQAFLYNQTLFIAFVKKLKLNLSIFKNLFLNNFIIYFFKLERTLLKRFFKNSMKYKILKAAVNPYLLPSVLIQDRYRNNPELLNRIRHSPILQEVIDRESIIRSRIKSIETDYYSMVGLSDSRFSIRRISFDFNRTSSVDFYRIWFNTNENSYSSRFVNSVTDEYRNFQFYIENCQLHNLEDTQYMGTLYRNSVDNFYQANHELFVLNKYINYHFPNSDAFPCDLAYNLRDIMIIFTDN